MGFTGYLLPWNQQSYWATTVGTQIAGTVPFIGDFILKVLRGGSELSALTLQRFFAAHIWMLPVALAGLIAFHLFQIIRHGESSWPTKED
jgi:quinol-cytochrome oxidoreductase complex cytochrome b subunit